MSEFQINQCPVCDYKQFSSFLTVTDYFVSGEQFLIKHCNGCGLKFTSNAENEEHIGKYYQSDQYISHSDTGKGIVNWVYHLVRKYMLGRKSNLVKRVTGKMEGHILDIGTGTGYFLKEMKKKGWQVTGTEKSADARQFAQKKLNLKLNPAEDLFSFNNQSFDAITLWHVLEHIHRLNDNMDTFFRLLKPNGKLIIAVPNYTSFDAQQYGEYWAAWDVPRHLWHFTPKNIRLLGEKHGFIVQNMYNMPFDSFYVSMLSERYKESSFPLFKGLITGKISWLISLTGEGRASSVIYVLEKAS